MTSLATVRVIGLVLLASTLVLVYFAAWKVYMRSVSLDWMLGGLCTAACHACFTKLDVTRVIWLAAGLPRACCKTD